MISCVTTGLKRCASACTTDGPLTVRDVNAAAEHLCFIHERFVKARVSPDTVREAYRASKKAGLRVKDMLRPEHVLTITKGTRRG